MLRIIKNESDIDLDLHALHQDEILSAMKYLNYQIIKIINYPDRSLFFQNPQILDRWLVLVRTMEKIEPLGAYKDNTDWEQRTEPYLAYLLTLHNLFNEYEKLWKSYYEPLKELIDFYDGWLEGECISSEGIEALISYKNEETLKDVEDIKLYLEELNSNSQKSRSEVHSVLVDILCIYVAVMNRGAQIVIDMEPSLTHFASAIDEDIREWTISFGKEMFKEMKEDLIRHYKEHRTDPYTPALWGEMLSSDEEALTMAKKQELAKCEAAKQEHWGEDMKKKMDENGMLMQQILSSCYNEELFELNKTERVQKFIELLTPDNLDMFYEIIVRRSLIQCEMFPNLKAQHDAWLKGDNVQPETMVSTEVKENVGCGIPTGAEAEENDIIIKYDHFVEAVKPYKFLECPAVACLNEKQRGQLVRKIVNRHDNYGAYAIAMLCELEYDKWMMENFVKNNPYSKRGLTKTVIFDHWKDALSLTSVRAVAGNFNVIRNSNSNEDKTTYKASEYTKVVHDEYIAIKDNTQASE